MHLKTDEDHMYKCEECSYETRHKRYLMSETFAKTQKSFRCES